MNPRKTTKWLPVFKDTLQLNALPSILWNTVLFEFTVSGKTWTVKGYVAEHSPENIYLSKVNNWNTRNGVKFVES